MRKHTPGPWRVAAKALVRLDQAYLIEPVDHHNFEYGAALAATSQHDARRIVACVNACAGMETEHLENQSMLGETLLDRFNLLKSEAGKLTKQRDELLAALHDAATSLETIQLRSFGADSFLDDKHSMRAYAGSRAAVARESMAKAKGGAVNHFPDAAKMAPDGWQLVPVEPTVIMVSDGASAQKKKLDSYALSGSWPPIGHGLDAAYQAMLAAAPKLGGE